MSKNKGTVRVQLRKFERVVVRWMVDADVNGLRDVEMMMTNTAMDRRHLRQSIRQTLRNLEDKGCICSPVDERGWTVTPLGLRLLRGPVAGLNVAPTLGDVAALGQDGTAAVDLG